MTLAWLQLSYRQTEAYSFSTETAVAFITGKIVAWFRDIACCHRNRRFQFHNAINFSSACTTFYRKTRCRVKVRPRLSLRRRTCRCERAQQASVTSPHKHEQSKKRRQTETETHHPSTIHEESSTTRFASSPLRVSISQTVP